jgi:hypothetical protein
LHRCCSTQPQALPRDKLLEEVVELRVTKSVQDILHAEFKTLNAKIESSNTALNAKIESSSTALNAKIESSNTALTNNFRQAMKDREVRSPCCVGVYNTSVSRALRREASLSKSWLLLRALFASWRCSDIKSASTRRAHERSVENDMGGVGYRTRVRGAYCALAAAREHLKFHTCSACPDAAPLRSQHTTERRA